MLRKNFILAGGYQKSSGYQNAVAVEITSLAADGTSATRRRARPTCRRPLDDSLPKTTATAYYSAATGSEIVRSGPQISKRCICADGKHPYNAGNADVH